MNRFLLVLAVLFCAIGGLAAGEPPATTTDPVVGQWIWIGRRDVTINANGTAKQPGEATAEWKLLNDNNTTERKYEFIWHRNGGAIFVHRVVLSPDHQRLDGANQKGQRVWAKRVD